MEYMEQQMQNYIEAGISEADRCYTRIAELEEQNAALAAQVEALKQSVISARARGNLLHNITMQILQGAELNGSDWDYISESQVAEIQQHLAEVRADAAIKGWWACWEWVDSDDRDTLTLIPAADQYADSIRKAR